MLGIMNWSQIVTSNRGRGGARYLPRDIFHMRLLKMEWSCSVVFCFQKVPIQLSSIP